MKHRIQFFVDDDEWREVLAQSAQKKRPISNMAYYALFQFFRRYPLKDSKDAQRSQDTR